jgi:hypothetical protein
MKRRTFIKSLCGLVAGVPFVDPSRIFPATETIKETYEHRLVTKPVEVEVRWHTESAACLRSQLNAEAEEELTQALAEEIMKEIDAEVMRDLRWTVQKRWAY